METIKRAAIVIILFGVGIIFGSWAVAENASKKMAEKQDLTPDQVVTSFYQKWKKENNPMADGFHTFKTDVTVDFKEYLSGFSGNINPITCSDSFPSRYSISSPEIEGDSATVIWSGSEVDKKAEIGLKFVNNRWLINSVSCGE